MKKGLFQIKKISIFLICLFALTACGTQEKVYNVDREGKLLNLDEKVLLYYPKNWELIEDGLKLSCDICNPDNDEALYLDVYETPEGNSEEEYLNLYVGKLQSIGAVIEGNEPIELDNGLQGYFIYGSHNKNNTLFCEVDVFYNNRQYVYSYIASKAVYETTWQNMKLFLQTLEITGVAN